MIFDKIDLQIIFALQQNGRCSYTRLAKHLGITSYTLNKKLERMIQNDVISIRAIPNPLRLGYLANMFVALNVELAKINEICARLLENNYIDMVNTTFGRFDVMAIANYPEWETLHDFVKSELSCMDGVLKIETFIISDVKKRYQSTFEDFHNKENTIFHPDSIDQRLIDELMQDGRTTYIELAKKLDLTVPTVARRVSNLIRENVIRIRGIPNPSKLGYSSKAFIGINADASNIENICNALADYSEIHLIVKLVSGFDILVGLQSNNPETLHQFMINEISKMDGIQNIEAFIRAEIKKRNYGWYMSEKDLENALHNVI